ncbi:hypothetical protein [Paracoccus sp. (in: a-proteobacteria)]|uniref:hypothetical protein n=1 Tax=Paracoccus sp. TaxID=267 RepID=UPI0026DF591E|nr:hypothetical protein [Paracoccus sp. (in: a-proteobacteria)]MDO5648622.1 hypothetical protein [Paracoccus sp. (in: a-proteobacteria)]
MMQRSYRILPVPFELPRLVAVIGLHYDLEGFRILLTDVSVPTTFRNFRFSFSSTPFAVRMIDEGDYLTTATPAGGLFSEVESSEYLEWLHRESQHVRAGQNLKHCAIYSMSECVDIIHSEVPKICEL